MGDWRTVNITGFIAPHDAAAAREWIFIQEYMRDDDYEKWDNSPRINCLCFYGYSVFGLGMWIPENGGPFSRTGNLSERDYGVEDVAETLRHLASIAPSLDMKIHCGGGWESTTCVATVTLHEGVVTVGPPEVQTVGDGLLEQGMEGFRRYLQEEL